MGYGALGHGVRSGVIAAAVAHGSSVIEGVHHLERGYNRPLETLQSLGLEVARTEADPAAATRPGPIR